MKKCPTCGEVSGSSFLFHPTVVVSNRKGKGWQSVKGPPRPALHTHTQHTHGHASQARPARVALLARVTFPGDRLPSGAPPQQLARLRGQAMQPRPLHAAPFSPLSPRPGMRRQPGGEFAHESPESARSSAWPPLPGRLHAGRPTGGQVSGGQSARSLARLPACAAAAAAAPTGRANARSEPREGAREAGAGGGSSSKLP